MVGNRARRLQGHLWSRKVPDAVRNLIQYSALKTLAQQIGIEVIDRRNSLLNVKFHAKTRVDPARLMNIVGSTHGAQFTPAGVLMLPLDGQSDAGAVLRFLAEKLEELRPAEGPGVPG